MTQSSKRARRVCVPLSSQVPPAQESHLECPVPSPRFPATTALAQCGPGPQSWPGPTASLPRVHSLPGWRSAILTQTSKRDGGMVFGAPLLGTMRVWAVAGGRLPAVVRLLLLRGHGQAAFPGRPADRLPRCFRGAPAQDGLDSEAGDATGRWTPLAHIFLAAHPGFIRNRRKPRTPFRDDLGGRWCKQAGRQGGGARNEAKGRGRRGWRRVPFALGTRARGTAAQGSLPAEFGAPAQPGCECPFLARRLAGSPAARRRRGLICIEVTGMRPIAAAQNGPGKFQKALARLTVQVSPPKHAENPTGISSVQVRPGPNAV